MKRWLRFTRLPAAVRLGRDEYHRPHPWVSWCLCCLMLLLVWGTVAVPQAIAAVHQLEEAPRQVLYQTRAALKDQQGRRWQAIAFKRHKPDGNSHVYLRLAGFPGSVSLDRAQPLTLSNSMGVTLAAADASSQIFSDAEHPEPHIGQYDLEGALPQLRPELPWQITLTTTDREVIRLSVPPSFVQDWQAIAEVE